MKLAKLISFGLAISLIIIYGIGLIVENSRGLQVEAQPEVGAWFFPGFCELEQTLHDVEWIDVIKPQWAFLNNEGELEFHLEEEICDGFSDQNVELLKSKSSRQYLNIVSLESVDNMRNLFDDQSKIEKFYSEVEKFLLAKEVQFDGVEIDFERSLEWSQEDFENYLDFLRGLKTRFDLLGLEVIVDMPAIDNQENLQVNHPFKYQDVAKLDLDGYVLMMYDYMYGKTQPASISPSQWSMNVVDFAQKEFGSEAEKLIGGVHSYGYKTPIQERVDTVEYFRYSELDSEIINQASGDINNELYLENEGYRYHFADNEFIIKRKELLEQKGLSQINIWQMIGNPYLESTSLRQ